MTLHTSSPTQASPAPAGAIARRLAQVVGGFILIGALLFLSAGTLSWFWGWVYIAVNVLILAFNALVMPRELIAERGAEQANQKDWDRWLTRVMILPYFLLPITAGLDARFHWSAALPLWLHWAGVAVYVLSMGFSTWAMLSNAYFSTAVRLQPERGQSVARGGPYRFVRHPGYVGFILYNLATPLMLGSWWAQVWALATAILFIVRTRLEDRTLQAELPGYADYAKKVRYRLIPGLW